LIAYIQALKKDGKADMRISLVFILLLATSYLIMNGASAHITGGLTKDVGQYRIQFISEPKFPTEGDKVLLYFNLQNATTGLDLYNQTASVTLIKDGQVLWDFGKQDARFANVMIHYIFDKAGQYTVSIELLSVKSPVRANFPLEVAGSFGAFFILLGIAVLAFVAIIFIVTRKVKNPQ
jgi:hypothetical protein